ncbi:recombinase family protein [Spirulina sp. CCNP1310]|uniref:recombinase family protein n=1 Tax=Spirulina sp. CCNP1310 TaxID=3110249 RepID=UPI002B1FA3EE|nr:recombinase family protein [Spirulina sp. CCNP1310]MEA5420560.1 recombinase family protein [Spirulina sp. CCNP1310]
MDLSSKPSNWDLERSPLRCPSRWITGPSRSGKTRRLIQVFEQGLSPGHPQGGGVRAVVPITPAVLILTANTTNQRDLSDRLFLEVGCRDPLVFKTPSGFIIDEVFLFWPLIFQALQLKAQFPLRLRPETEQELATTLWQRELDDLGLDTAGVMEYRFVRDTLDLLQLAGAGGFAPAEIAPRLSQGLAGDTWETKPEMSEKRGDLLHHWQQWCLERGLLSYGLIYDLYGRYLLGDRHYQRQLLRRYRGIFADDVDDYPALMADFLQTALTAEIPCVVTFNPNGQNRLGLNADPYALAQIQSTFAHCETLATAGGLGETLTPIMMKVIQSPSELIPLPPMVELLQICRGEEEPEFLPISRAALLRATAERLIKAVKQEGIAPGDIAVIGPGLDAIARYTLMEILKKQDIAVEPLNEQRPLITSPLVRALLTLLTLVYPGLGALIDRDRLAEMLVVLSDRQPGQIPPTAIDPVRAGLLSDHCYHFDPQHPRLLPVTDYPRWDRFGHQVVTAYNRIRDWLESQTQQIQESAPHPPIPPVVLNAAIEQFFNKTRTLSYGELAVLRGLMETAQHFWEVDTRLRQNEGVQRSPLETLSQFIQLLRRGTITANAYPAHRETGENAVLLATIYQYRNLRRSHRWHFWLDVGSNLWQSGGATDLFAHHCFLRENPGRPWTAEEQTERQTAKLTRVLADLTARIEERLILCHSELAVNGMEQRGPLSPLIDAAQIQGVLN